MSPGRLDPKEEDDPVVAEYDVYITQPLLEKLYVLQYPNRSRQQLYSVAQHAKPQQLRVKPDSGFIEVDVPLNIQANFDKRKAINWGHSMKKMREEGNGQSFGLAAGFSSKVLPAAKPRGGGANSGTATPKPEGDVMELDVEDEVDRLLRNFNDASEKGYVMNTQTLGGKAMRPKEGESMYMTGVFRGNQLHLTKVNGGIVQMRPQFHHLDAKAQLEVAARQREARGAAEPKAPEPRAVMTTLRTMNDEEMTIGNTKDFLSRAEHEPWTRCVYHDYENDKSYASFEKLKVDDETVPSAPRLQSSWTNEQYLEEMSAPRKDPSGQKRTKPLTKKQMRAVEKQAEEDAMEAAAAPATADADEDMVPEPVVAEHGAASLAGDGIGS